MQTTFAANPAVAYPGMPVDTGFTDDISAIVGTSAGIEPGLFVVRGGAGGERPPIGVVPAAIAATSVLGVVLRTQKTRLDLSASGNEVYENQSSIPVRRKGRVWVVVENTFTAGANVYVRTVAAGAEKLGAVRTDTDSGDAVLLAGARLMTSGGAGELGILELNL